MLNSMAEIVLKTNDLCKTYGTQRVLDNVCMTIEKGDIYGFVGENGSGKTTVIRAITGLITPTSGDFELYGVKSTEPGILEKRAKIGAVVEAPSVYPALTAKQNLRVMQMMLGVSDEEKIKKALAMVGLQDMYDNKKVAKHYSLGMRQRLGIAMALISTPDFLVLDEPLNGLDPEGIVEIRNLILSLNRDYGITFLISSHILTELSLVATKYGIISKGHILKEITKEELDSSCKRKIIIESSDIEGLHQALLTVVSESELTKTVNGYQVDSYIEYNKILSCLSSIKISNIKTVETSIEDYYLSIIKGGRQ